MCEFFSFIVSESNGVFSAYYFNSAQRVDIEDCDSHSHIAEHFLGTPFMEDRCGKYEFVKGRCIIDSSCCDDMDRWAKDWIEEFQFSQEFRDICFGEVKQEGTALRNIPEHLKTYDMCMIAVQRYGLAIVYVPEHLKTEQLCLIAVQQYAFALKFVPEHLTEAVLLAKKNIANTQDLTNTIS